MPTLFMTFKVFSACAILMMFGIQLSHAAPENGVPNSAENIVRMLYHDYAWEALGDELGKTTLEEQSTQELGKYFDSSLSQLIKEDSDCVERTEGICNLDFNIIFASQDPAAYELDVSSINKKNEIKVQFKYPSNHEVISLVYMMANTPKGWRIHDIVYENEHTSLLALLK